jgi:hypothetical protein
MIRISKAFCGAVAVVVALLGLPAAGMAAVEFHSDSSSGNTWLTGSSTGNHVIDTAGSTLTCKKASFVGLQSGNTASAAEFEAAYSECTVAIGEFNLAATLSMGSCRYRLTASGFFEIVGTFDVLHGDNLCSTFPITWKVSNFLGSCTVKIGPTIAAKSSVKYDGATTVANGDVVITPAVSLIAGKAEGNLCPVSGEFTNGNYTSGPITLKGFVYSGGSEGAQTPIWVA